MADFNAHHASGFNAPIASGFNALGPGGGRVLWWGGVINSGEDGKFAELDVEDFSVIRSKVTPSGVFTREIDGDAETIWWVSDGGGTVVKLLNEVNPEDFTVIKGTDNPYPPGEGGDFAAGGGADVIWTAALTLDSRGNTYNGAKELDPADFSIVKTGDLPEAIHLDGDDVERHSVGGKSGVIWYYHKENDGESPPAEDYHNYELNPFDFSTLQIVDVENTPIAFPAYIGGSPEHVWYASINNVGETKEFELDPDDLVTVIRSNDISALELTGGIGGN